LGVERKKLKRTDAAAALYFFITENCVFSREQQLGSAVAKMVVNSMIHSRNSDIDRDNAVAGKNKFPGLLISGVFSHSSFAWEEHPSLCFVCAQIVTL
jgi:hypothetical protein